MSAGEENGKKSLNGRAPDPATWVDRFGDELYSYALTRLRNSHAAEEVVQETMMAGVRYVRQFRGDSTEKAWLMSILRRKIVDHVRTRNRHSCRDAILQQDVRVEAFLNHLGNFDASLIPENIDPSELAKNRELWELVRRCLEDIPKRQADAFMLRELEGLSAEDICEALEISRSNLWVLLHRARVRIAECLFELWSKGNSCEAGDNVP